MINLWFHFDTTTADSGSLSKRHDNADFASCLNYLSSVCRCSPEIINCTNARYTHTDIFLSITDLNWPRLDTLILTGNNFPNMDSFLFGVGTRHRRLKVLNLSENRIRRIDLQTFDNLTNLEHLILSRNQIFIDGADERAYQFLRRLSTLRILELDDAFDKTATAYDLARTIKFLLSNLNRLNRLEYLHLKNNRLTFLQPATFCNVPSVQYLYLQDNRLESFGGSLINEKCTPSLTELYLNNNSLSRFSRFDLDKFDSDIHWNKFSFANNPFECYCELNPFIKWFKKNSHRIVDKTMTRCQKAYPDRFVNSTLMKIPENALKCDSERSTDYMHGIYVICGLAIVGMSVMLFCIFYANKRSLIRGFCCCWTKKGGAVNNFRVTSNGYQILDKEPEVKAEMV
uniref:Uncharacterized protein n=1 Tax=Romanomermis culicivorax TaxID=13658 RepID=A0A915ITW3_ROMCU